MSAPREKEPESHECRDPLWSKLYKPNTGYMPLTSRWYVVLSKMPLLYGHVFLNHLFLPVNDCDAFPNAETIDFNSYFVFSYVFEGLLAPNNRVTVGSG